MKSIFLAAVLALFAFCARAQNYDDVKKYMILNNFKLAKDNLDKETNNAKYWSKPEGYLLKASVYAGLSMDNAIKLTPQGDQLRSDGLAAFNKYKEMQPDLSLLKDAVYQNGPINLYSSFFASGYDDYTKKNWQHGYETFQKVMALSDLLIREKMITATLDTNALVLAGLMSESSDHKDDAAMYYGRLAEAKVNAGDYESIYRYLVRYYFGKKDMASFEKYKALGKQLYPKSEFFDYDKVDFAVGMQDNFNDKLKAVEDMISSDPSNYKANELLGEIIYDTLEKENTVIPANAAELEKKMVDAFNKAGELNPGSESSFLHLGNVYINKAIKLDDAKTAFATEMKGRTKPGTPPSKADQQKKDDLEAQYGAALESARAPFEKAADIYSKKGTSINLPDKAQYRRTASYLEDIYSYKKGKAKPGTPELAKYTAEEKKWSDLYDALK